MINCVLAGVGGQGTVLASKLLAQAAMDQGLGVHTAETIGMAQRGGSVVSHVRIGPEAVSPLVPLASADILVGFESAEAVRSIALLAPGGRIVVNTGAIVPFTCSLASQAYEAADMLAYLAQFPGTLCIDGAAICRQVGTDKVLNVALLGAAVATGVFPFTVDAVEGTIDYFLPAPIRAMNKKALRLGAAQATSA